ncbi:hypothetical protein Tco_1548698 [Tanacetum coccineum]
MEISIADQIALDDALVAPADRLKIGKCNLRLSSDVTSKEATLQVVYNVLKLTPFYKAFQVTADAPEIYMLEFWASAYVHNRSVRFKMNNKKHIHIPDLDQFRDIRRSLTLMSISCINPGDHLLLSSTNVSVIETENTRRAMRWVQSSFTRLVVNFVRDKDPSILKEQVALTNEESRNSESYKEYYAIAIRKQFPPKTKEIRRSYTDTTTKQMPPHCPKRKRSLEKESRRLQFETDTEGGFDRAEQLKIKQKEAVKKLTALLPVSGQE